MLSFARHLVSRQGCIAGAGLDFISRAFPNHEPFSFVEFHFVGIRFDHTRHWELLGRRLIESVSVRLGTVQTIPLYGGAWRGFVGFIEFEVASLSSTGKGFDTETGRNGRGGVASLSVRSTCDDVLVTRDIAWTSGRI